MKVIVSEAEGDVLNYLVAKCQGIELTGGRYNRLLVDGHMSRGQEMMAPYKPTTDWAQGGPIIEREQIATWLNGDDEWAATDGWKNSTGQTPLIAAMRSYVASKLGDEVEVPDELINNQGERQ